MANRERTVCLEAEVGGRSFSFEKETLTLVGEKEPRVITAYFAEKIIELKEEDSTDTFTYIFNYNNDVKTQEEKTAVANSIRKNLTFNGDKKYTDNQKIIAALTKQTYKKGETITIAALKKEKKEYYKKLETAPMGYQVYLVAETEKLESKTLKIKIQESKSQNQEKKDVLKLVEKETDALPVLVFAKLEDKTTTTESSDWIDIDIKKQDGKILNKTAGTDIEVGIKKIQLRPKESKIKTKGENAVKSFEGWQEALYIREDETEAGKKAIKDAEETKAVRDAEPFKTLTRDADADKKVNKKSYPKKISGPKTIEIGKEAIYTVTEYGASATKADKNNIRWSIWVNGNKKTDYKIIDTKSKAGLYTYAKMELVGDKNKLTIVFDKALKGKKVQIEPYRGTPDINNAKDYVRTTTIKEPATPKIVIRDKAHLYLKTQCDSVVCVGEKIENTFKSTLIKLITPNTIHIYEDGKMSKLNLEGLKKVKYRYHDANGDKYDVCECELYEIDERLKGVSNDKKNIHTVETGYYSNSIVTYSHVSDRKKYTYPDGTIRTYGKFYNPDKGTYYRLVTYKKGNSKKHLVKMPDNLNKKIVTKSILYSFTKTARRYCGPEHLAAFIGALADNGYRIKSGGACEKDGTCYPSVSHINGQSVDTNYLSSNTEEQNFINAMHKFGFGSQLRGSGKKAFKNTLNGGKLHNNHLHSGGLTPNYK